MSPSGSSNCISGFSSSSSGTMYSDFITALIPISSEALLSSCRWFLAIFEICPPSLLGFLFKPLLLVSVVPLLFSGLAFPLL